MSLITLKTLPRIKFAHTYSAEDYHTYQPPKNGIIEVTVCTEGQLILEQNGKTCVFEKDMVACSFFDSPRKISIEDYHCHHTVCFVAEYEHSLPSLLILRDEARECLRLIDEIIKTNLHTPEDSHKLTGLFLLLLGEVERLYSHRNSDGFNAGELYVRRAKRYIYDHIKEPIAQKDVAAMLGITPEYLCTIFKESEGSSLIRFINETKLTLIRNMMENEQITLAKAALQYGFSDPNYVSRLYKKYYNEPITQSAKAMKNTRA